MITEILDLVGSKLSLRNEHIRPQFEGAIIIRLRTDCRRGREPLSPGLRFENRWRDPNPAIEPTRYGANLVSGLG